MKLRRLMFAGTILFSFLALSTSAQTGNSEKRHIGLPQDWSQQHLIFTNRTNQRVSNTEQANPRAINARLARTRAHDVLKDWNLRRWPVSKKKSQIDWSVDLGATMAVNTFPAKYSFDVNAAPDCVNDYVVFGLNAGGTPTQANIVGLNDLYSGSAPDGICNNHGTDGNGLSANVYWAYYVPNAITTSTVLSLDGTKVAFLESGTPASFHVLAWKPNDGQVHSASAPLSTSTAPVSGTGQMTSLALSSCGGGAPSSISSPYVDYANDIAYVANDNGCLFRIKDVFCATVSCQTNPVPPSLDVSWNGTGSVSLSSGAQLGGPIYDSGTGNVFVGSTNGKTFGINAQSLQQTSLSGIAFGSGPFSTSANIMVDSFNQWVYLYLPNANNLGIVDPVLIQLKTTSSVPLIPIAQIGVGNGLGNMGPLFLGAFNDAYFTDPDPSKWFLYVCNFVGGVGPDANAPAIYRIGFDSSHLLLPNSDAAILKLGSAAADQCAGDLTEFKGSDGKDRLFYSLATAGVVGYVDISGTTPALGAPTPVASPGGTTGIIVDNVSTAAQASSIYFMQLGSTKAVKLTQAGLQ